MSVGGVDTPHQVYKQRKDARMDHLQQAKRAIEDAATTQGNERAVLIAQLAIAHALVAIVERMDKDAGRERIDYILEHD